MSAWKSWGKRRFKPVIIEHPKEAKWKIAATIIFDRFLNYSNYKLLGICGAGFVGLVFLYSEGYRQSQRRLYKYPYSVLALEKFKKQKKLLSLIGEPLKFGYIVPSYKNAIQKDSVDMIIPITGSKAEGVLSVEAHKVDDTWILDDLTFQFIDKAGGVVQIMKESD